MVLSSEYDKSIAQVTLPLLIQKEVVAIPKSTHLKRINQNFNVFDSELPADDLTAIKSLVKVVDFITVLKTVENLTTTITNWATFYRTTIRSFAMRFIQC